MNMEDPESDSELQATPCAKAWEKCVSLRHMASTFQLVPALGP